MPVIVFGYYHGHLTETFLNHFDDMFTSASSITKNALGDSLGAVVLSRSGSCGGKLLNIRADLGQAAGRFCLIQAVWVDGNIFKYRSIAV